MNGSQQQEADEAAGSASQSAAQQQPGSSGNPRNSGGIELSDDEEWSSLVERAVLERTKSDRSTRADGDRRRRTIIVEKKNGTYGFTLQSYGIHYKREQEIEMVTYVDYVEYDGPAFKAGMREGDVILSINGQEMDRADHKTLVNFIKNCDARMRMVVSFEDCVRKVELHMRYIELQRALQSRLSELERLCERERSILMGRWKTHSLPARKRTPQGVSGESSLEPTSSSTLNSATTQSCCRPASSTEHLKIFFMQYADGRSFLIPRSAACLVAIGPPRSRSDHHHFLSNVSVESTATATSTTSSSRHSYHQANGLSNSNTPSKSKDRSTHSSKTNLQAQEQRQPERQGTENQNLHPSSRNLCVACISSASRRNRSDQAPQGDGGSLDAYDLASPCCDPNCVPSRRRREKQRRARHEQGSQTHQHQQQQQKQQQQQQQQQQSQQQAVQTQTTSQREQRDAQAQTQPREHHSSQHNCSRASGHSLHSITSSEMSTGVADSVVSCSTSLSTDTLYWDPNVQHRPPPCLQYAKPKSWDNLTTKAFGGYGFGYGYLDTAKSTHSAERPAKSGSSSSHHGRAKTPTNSSSSSCSQSRRTSGTQVYSSNSGSGRQHFQPTKSTESLLIATPYPTELDATLSCECLDGPNPRFIAVQLEKHKRQNDASSAYATRAEAQQQVRHRRSSHSDAKQRSSINASEITRL